MEIGKFQRTNGHSSAVEWRSFVLMNIIARDGTNIIPFLPNK